MQASRRVGDLSIGTTLIDEVVLGENGIFTISAKSVPKRLKLSFAPITMQKLVTKYVTKRKE